MIGKKKKTLENRRRHAAIQDLADFVDSPCGLSQEEVKCTNDRAKDGNLICFIFQFVGAIVFVGMFMKKYFPFVAFFIVILFSYKLHFPLFLFLF